MKEEINLDKNQEEKLKKIAKEKRLKFIIMYGSMAKGQNKTQSDLDIAVLGEKEISLKEYSYLFSQFSEVFPGKEIDLKSLHHTDPLFRYLVLRDGILLYGDPTNYLEFKIYALRDYQESGSLFRLQKKLIQKRQKLLLALAPPYDR